MAPRVDLQRKLENILGSKNVYFQPPEDVKLQYPCIIYNLDGAKTKFADNDPYKYDRRYKITYVDRNPESPIVDKLAMMRMTTLSNWMAVDGLNQYTYSTYF